jgi:protein-L-isoaspartate(D-aspartate) O-methyltransferase
MRDEFARERERMVADQIRARGVTSEAVLAAMQRVPRDVFVPAEQRGHAYEDRPLSIGAGQTISQPYIVGYMSELLDVRPTSRVLEIGTGSGYQAAILAELAAEVYTIETVAGLAEQARETLATLGYDNVHTRTGNGYLGWPEAAPFDRIVLTAAPPALPEALVDQLAEGGILIAPVGGPFAPQVITVVRRTSGEIETSETIPVQFVPMVDR